jgi:simple sugar transport system ATP-binding protein
LSEPSEEVVLRLSNVTKRFGDLVANDHISLELRRGEVLGLLGENGAGKTTLMSILFGHYVADEGSIEAFGAPLPPGSPRGAIAAGIGMVHQHFTLADNLTVLDNIMLGSEPLWRLRSDHRGATRKLEDLSTRFGLAVDPTALIADLAVGERQRVEILKALYRDARILILDEPTAVLTPQETESLFHTLGQMSEQGLSLIFISHKLNEVLSASHRVVVLRGGRVVGERPATDTNGEQLAEMIVGHELPETTRRPLAPGEPVLELRDVSAQDSGRRVLEHINLTIRSREILGVVGVSGNGQGPLAQVAGGFLTPSTGDSLLFGDSIARSNAMRDTAGRVGRIPDDRHALGLVSDMAIWENAILDTSNRRRFAHLGVLRRKAAMSFAQTLIDRFDIRCRGPGAVTGLLSGGNMQKLILGRIFSLDPQFIIANQPTRGLDVGAIAFVQERLLEARESGAAILLISEDLDELLSLADRVAVIYRGRLTEPKPAGELTRREIGLLMAGQWREAGHAH